MPVPTELQRELNFLRNKLDRLEKADPSSDDFVFELAELVSGLSHFLDKTMNTVWSQFASRSDTSKKPSIYFPCQNTDDRLDETLSRLQLGDLKIKRPKLYRVIQSAQPYGSSTLLRALKSISNLKHERLPEVRSKISQRVGIGKGQDMYIGQMSSDGMNTFISGSYGINRATGAREPLKNRVHQRGQAHH